MKKTGDVSLLERTYAALVLMLVFPLLGSIAAYIGMSSEGPVLVKDEWLHNGGVASTYRFRTTDRGSSMFLAIGRFLRECSLDSLPSLWNVLRGEVRFRDLLVRSGTR